MYFFEVYKPSCFVNNQFEDLIIYKNDLVFYTAKKGKKFQLPIGVYKSNFEPQFICEYRRKFKPYTKEYYKPLPKFEVHRVSNPSKATVFFDGNIFLDKEFFDAKHDIVKNAILYHEEAHQFYKNESKCDHYAKEKLLCEGYNPSQVISAFKATGLNHTRICKLHNDLKK